MSALGDYSVKSCSKSKTTGNINEKILTGSGTGETGNQGFQNSILDAVETIIQNRVDPDYKRAEIPLVDITPIVPAVPGTGAIAFILDTNAGNDFTANPSESYQILFDQATGNFQLTIGSNPPIILPYSNVIQTGGAIINNTNLEYNTGTGIVTFRAYFDDGSPYENTNLTREFSFNLSTVLTNAVPPVDAVTALSNFTFSVFRNDNGTPYTSSPIAFISPASVLIGGYFFGPGSYRSTQRATNTVDGGSEDITIFVQPGTEYTAEIPAGLGHLLYLFYVPSSVTQTEAAIASLFARFLAKEDALTEGTTTEITNTTQVAFFNYLAELTFESLKKAAKLITESEDDICPAITDGRFKSCIETCVFTLNIDVV